MKIRKGYIPSEIVQISFQTTKDLLIWLDVQPVNPHCKEVIETFCADANDPKAIEKCEEIAEYASMRHDGDKPQLKKVRRENQPISNIRIISLEQAGFPSQLEHKVITEDGHFFSVESDVFLDAVVQEGIERGGILPGEYIWACVESKTKLVRVGSALHTALLEASERTILSTIPPKKLKVGTVYETKRGETALFLGFVDYWKYELKWDGKTYEEMHRGGFWRNGGWELPILTRKFYKKQMLWFPFGQIYERIDTAHSHLSQMLNEAAARPERSIREFVVKSNHSMVKPILGDVPLPNNLIASLRQKAKTDFELGISNEPHRSMWEKTILGAYALKWATLRPHGESEPVVNQADLIAIQSKLGQAINKY